MVKVGIAVGVAVGAFLLVCCFCWATCKLRQSFKTGRIGATLEEILVEKRKGVKKDVVRTFPIVETSELNFETNTKLQCPICWLQFRETDTVRQLPHCDHVFHRHCIDPVLENQITCPVCGTILSDNPKKSEEILSGKNKKNTDNFKKSEEILSGRNKKNNSPATVVLAPAPFQKQVSLRSLYSINNTAAESAAQASPPWILVNRPVPLPITQNERSGSSDRFEIELNPSESYGGSGKLPLLSKCVEEWQTDDIDLDPNCIDISFTFGTEVPVEKRKPGNPNEKGMDTFTFTPPGGKPAMAPAMAPGFRSSLRRSRGNESASFSDASTRFSRSTSRSSRSTSSSSSDSRFDKFDRWDHHAPQQQPDLEDVVEGRGSEDLPLTKRPDQCSFDVLPVISGSDEVHRKRGQS